eukprot:1551348-Rhodomonas_salina.1
MVRRADDVLVRAVDLRGARGRREKPESKRPGIKESGLRRLGGGGDLGPLGAPLLRHIHKPLHSAHLPHQDTAARRTGRDGCFARSACVCLWKQHRSLWLPSCCGACQMRDRREQSTDLTLLETRAAPLHLDVDACKHSPARVSALDAQALQDKCAPHAKMKEREGERERGRGREGEGEGEGERAQRKMSRPDGWCSQ